MFPQERNEGALRSRPCPTTPIGYCQARELLLIRYGRLPEGRGEEAFGPTLADYIFAEISIRAGACGDEAHYKVIDNGLWHLLGQYAEPPPGAHSFAYLPPNNTPGRRQTGNVYEALVGLCWLECRTHELVDLFLTLMDLDQIEYAQNTHSGHPRTERAPQVPCEGPTYALRCSRFALVRASRNYGYANGQPSPAAGAVAEPREEWPQDPGKALWIPEWVESYTSEMPKGNPLPPPPPKAPVPPARWGPQGRRLRRRGTVELQRLWWLEEHQGPRLRGGQDGAAHNSGPQGEQGGTPAQERRNQAYPCPPDPRGKYLICYIEGQDVPRPCPHKDTVIFKITADGTQRFEAFYPLTRERLGNAFVETF